jgi:hypothetical protein
MSRLTPPHAKECRPSTKPADRRLPAYRSFRRWSGRLGPVDYTLLAMVAVGIATTVAMAIFNPSG